MIIFPPCKINIGLQVTARRPDGFHEIATVFYPLPLTDVLEIVTAGEETTTFHLSGLAVPGESESNLCVRAYRLLKQDFQQLPCVNIYLHKAIPAGAGLGGGSSDAAATLMVLNNRYHLGLSAEQLADYALRLGSDCAFFLQDRPCYATGRGELLHPLTLNLTDRYRLVVVCPELHISTAWAYGQVHPEMSATPLADAVAQPVDTWKGRIVNDFEQAVFKAHPALAGIRDSLYRQGALYASLSGTGAAVYGIFPPPYEAPEGIFGQARVFQF